VLTLFVVPAAYVLVDRLVSVGLGRVRSLRRGQRDVAVNGSDAVVMRDGGA
jgi:hypothetical protein